MAKKATEYIHAIFIAILLVVLIDLFTNTIPPHWDALNYLDMARSGILGNDNLVAPFAYRPGMPFLSRAMSELFSVPIEQGFQIIAYIAAVGLLMSTFMLARCFTDDFGQAIIPVVIIGLLFVHIKVPLFFYTFVDISAYPLIVIAFWALVKKRYVLCLMVSSIGLLFKEFLVIPLLLLIVQFTRLYWHDRSRRNLFYLLITISIGASVILIPRLCIPVQDSYQEIDPINKPRTLAKLLDNPLDELRNINIFYAMMSYWLPSLLLLTTDRFKTIWFELEELKELMAIYLGVDLLLTMYGGSNLPIFVAYSVPVQIVILAILLKHGVHLIELVFMLVAMLMYNKILLNIPLPEKSFNVYIDFYGGYASRVNITTVVRFIEMFMYILISKGLRTIIHIHHSGSKLI
jgi:hypothetical protein